MVWVSLNYQYHFVMPFEALTDSIEVKANDTSGAKRVKNIFTTKGIIVDLHPFKGIIKKNHCGYT